MLKRQILFILSFTLALIIFDQFTKYLAGTDLKTGFSVIGGFFQLRYGENTGMAFGIPVPQVALIILNTILIIAVIYIAGKELNLKHSLTRGAVALIIGGGISNLIDRVFRGFVIDFISIWKWPAFNFADAYITIGILLIIMFYGKLKKIK